MLFYWYRSENGPHCPWPCCHTVSSSWIMLMFILAWHCCWWSGLWIFLIIIIIRQTCYLFLPSQLRHRSFSISCRKLCTLSHHRAIDCFPSNRFIGYAPCSYVGTRVTRMRRGQCVSPVWIEIAASDAAAYGGTAEKISPLPNTTAAVSPHCLDKRHCE